MLWAVLAAMALPLLWPTVPPLTDFPGHLGRYRVQIELASSPGLQRFYAFEWALIGNLGVDLLIMPLAALFGLEPAGKLIAIGIPVLTAAGALFVAREVHGRLSPTAFFALPLAYNQAFLFGFVNFALSMALALVGLGLWLRLDRLCRLRLRAILFVPLSVLLWTAHVFGWGALGAMAFSAEAVRAYDRGGRILPAMWKAGLRCLPLAPPVLLLLFWRGNNAEGTTGDWFNWGLKLDYALAILRDRWETWDLASLAVIALVILAGAASRRLEFSRNLLVSALFLALLYLLIPRILFGSAYADMRLAPYVLLLAVIAVRFREAAVGRLGHVFAGLGLLFLAARLVTATASTAAYDARYDRELAALDALPRDARLVSLVGLPCRDHWARPRTEHLPSMALVRRGAFANDQWTMPGAQLLTVRYARGAPFSQDPSQIVTDARCPHPSWLSIDQALARIPRDAFDYLWLVDPPQLDPALLAPYDVVQRSGRGGLYRLRGSAQQGHQ